jgi:hypothetical protein
MTRVHRPQWRRRHWSLPLPLCTSSSSAPLPLVGDSPIAARAASCALSPSARPHPRQCRYVGFLPGALPGRAWLLARPCGDRPPCSLPAAAVAHPCSQTTSPHRAAADPARADDLGSAPTSPASATVYNATINIVLLPQHRQCKVSLLFLFPFW